MSVSRTQPRRRLVTVLQQSIADGMAERVVDLLEAVEIEHQHGEAAPALRMAAIACSSRSRIRARLGRSVSTS